MKKYVCILRGINVGGRNKVLKDDLIELFESLNYKFVNTYIQSGNIGFFDPENRIIADLEVEIQLAIVDWFDLGIPVIVRSQKEMEEIVKNNPFDTEENVHLTFLKEKPSNEELENIQKYNFPPDEYKIVGKNIYLKCGDKYSKTKLNNQFFERYLKVNATTRNWKTVKKLNQLSGN